MSSLPPFFDLQVNGYGGVDFNQDDLSPLALHQACEALSAAGVAGILATVITENLDHMCKRLGRLAELRARDPLAQQLIAGFHIEGPFISSEAGYVGAHPADAVIDADRDAMQRLLDASQGLTRLVTLAPERDPTGRVISLLAKQNITVSAGHTNASTDQLRAAIDAGLSMFTHLGNGCPMLMHRHDNIIQRVLALRERLMISFIPDGVHIHFTALKNYFDLVGMDRAVVVTDAIAPAGKGPGQYQLGRWNLNIGPDMVARAPDGSHLVGSAITMPRIWQNLTENLGLCEAEARKLTSDNPRQVMIAQSGR